MNVWSGGAGPKVPECFGKSWDGKDPLCAGGLNPAFTDEKGGHLQPRCAHFETCGTRVQAKRLETAQPLVPASNLTRSFGSYPRSPGEPQPAPPAPASPQPFQMQQIMQQIAQLQAQAQRPQVQYTTPSAPAWAPAQHAPAAPVHGYQQMMPVNFQMPGYLTVREETTGGSILWMLLREILRSIAKSIGHTLAHFFDVTPLKRKE